MNIIINPNNTVLDINKKYKEETLISSIKAKEKNTNDSSETFEISIAGEKHIAAYSALKNADCNIKIISKSYLILHLQFSR